MSRSGLRRQPLHGADAAGRGTRPDARLGSGEVPLSPGRRRANMDGGPTRAKPGGMGSFSEDSEDPDTSQDSRLSDFSGEESAGPSPVASRTRSKDSVERDLKRRKAAKAGSKQRASKENVETVAQTKASPLQARTSPLRSDRSKVDGAAKNATDPAALCMYIVIIGLVIVALTAIVLPMLRKDPLQSQGAPAIDSPELYKEYVRKLKTLFPNQNQRTWTVIGAMGRALLYPPAIITQPAVLLVASAPGTHDTARCVARLVAQGFDKRPTVVHGEQLKGLDADEAKKRLDEVLHAGFSQGGKAAVVYSLQDIPLQANLIFHSYCDNTNAPYKETAIILVLQLEEPIHMDRSNSEIEGEAMDRLQNHLERDWVLDIDKVGALMSRMAGFVLVVDKSDDLPTSCS
ncbi:torsin-1A-interacting protein 2-like [Branchiostoma lanceolatum]|uniref:torsin-1A-interacting protein 2-like n=1 Tax=Branchiostoma lanceolatum TaxID=7740 RepID=UPI003455E59D